MLGSFTLARIILSYASTQLRLPWQEYEASGNVGEHKTIVLCCGVAWQSYKALLGLYTLLCHIGLICRQRWTVYQANEMSWKLSFLESLHKCEIALVWKQHQIQPDLTQIESHLILDHQTGPSSQEVHRSSGQLFSKLFSSLTNF